LPGISPSTRRAENRSIGWSTSATTAGSFSVNTGISCLIDSSGRIRNAPIASSEGFPPEAMQRTGMPGWFLDKMPIDNRVTFYSRHGQWLDTGCAVAFVAVLVGPASVGLARRRTRRPSKSAA
jgi:apolipoprotein N-acyltransferase